MIDATSKLAVAYLTHRIIITAVTGVWRRKTIVAVGGWKSRTTVEDMDLSLRTYVNGWKAIYLHDVVCVNEVHPILWTSCCDPED